MCPLFETHRQPHRAGVERDARPVSPEEPGLRGQASTLGQGGAQENRSKEDTRGMQKNQSGGHCNHLVRDDRSEDSSQFPQCLGHPATSILDETTGV